MVFLLITVSLDEAQILFDLIFIFVFLQNLAGINLGRMMASTASMTFVFLEALSSTLTLTYISRRTVGFSIIIWSSFLVLVFLNQQLKLPEYLKSIFFILEGGCRLAFASILTAFFTAFFHKSRSQFWSSLRAHIDWYMFLRKYQISAFRWGGAERFNFFNTTGICFRYTAWSLAFSIWYWESLLYLA